MKTFLMLTLSFIAGSLGEYFGGWGGLGAVVIGELAMAIAFYPES